MLVVIALGGNALLRRGQPLDATVQRANAKVAAEVIAEISRDHQVVLTHGNGPQVGLLALQNDAYEEVRPYPLDILDAESEGMVGYVLEQELGRRIPPSRLATLLTQVVVSQQRPRLRPPHQAGRPHLRLGGCGSAGQGARLDHRPGRLPLAAGRPIPGAQAHRGAAGHPAARRCRARRDLRGRRRRPGGRAAPHGHPRRRSGDRQGSLGRAARHAAGGRRAPAPHRRRCRVRPVGTLPRRGRSARHRSPSCGRSMRRPARWAPRSRRSAASSILEAAWPRSARWRTQWRCWPASEGPCSAAAEGRQPRAREAGGHADRSTARPS